MIKKKVTTTIIIGLIMIALLSGCTNSNNTSHPSNNNVKSSNANNESEDFSTEEIEEYLLDNYSSIDLKDNTEFIDLKFMDEELKDKEIFFTAEAHGVKTNEELEQKFLQYFKEKTDFKYYLLENSYSNVYFINKYLESGDISILDQVFKSIRGTYAWNKDGYNHWIWFYKYNKSLPQDKKIKLVGVDIEHQPVNAFRYLEDILPDKEPPEAIKKTIDYIKSINDAHNQSNKAPISEYANVIYDDIKIKETIYREYLGEDFIGFNLVTKNILNRIEAYDAKKMKKDRFYFNKTRDKMIYENFMILQKELPYGKFYGQWGLNHAFQKKENDIMWFAGYLNADDSIYKDKLLSIIYNYDQCEFMTKKSNGKYSTKINSFVNPQIKEINDKLDSNLNIFKLSSTNSPFFSVPMKDSVTGDDLQNSIAEYFQYILIIKDSKATEPLE